MNGKSFKWWKTLIENFLYFKNKIVIRNYLIVILRLPIYTVYDIFEVYNLRGCFFFYIKYTSTFHVPLLTNAIWTSLQGNRGKSSLWPLEFSFFSIWTLEFYDFIFQSLKFTIIMFQSYIMWYWRESHREMKRREREFARPHFDYKKDQYRC